MMIMNKSELCDIVNMNKLFRMMIYFDDVNV